MIRPLVAVVAALLLLLPAVALAQDNPEPEEPGAPGAGVVPTGGRKTLGSAPQNEARPPVSGERVEIRVRPGIVLTGVVKSKQFEVLLGTNYVRAEGPDQPGAGLRVYYALGLNGYIFIRQDAVEEIRFLGELSDIEIQAIVAELEAAEEKAERDRARARAERAARRAAARGEEIPEIGEEGEAPEPEGFESTERTEKIRGLLERFPPAEWKPSRLDEIKKRVVILDIFPNEEERAFIDNYDLWLEGYRLWEAAQEETGKEKGEGEAGEKETSGGR